MSTQDRVYEDAENVRRSQQTQDEASGVETVADYVSSCGHLFAIGLCIGVVYGAIRIAFSR